MDMITSRAPPRRVNGKVAARRYRARGKVARTEIKGNVYRTYRLGLPGGLPETPMWTRHHIASPDQHPLSPSAPLLSMSMVTKQIASHGACTGGGKS